MSAGRLAMSAAPPASASGRPLPSGVWALELAEPAVLAVVAAAAVSVGGLLFRRGGRRATSGRRWSERDFLTYEDLVDEEVRGDHLAFNAHLHDRLAGQRFVPVHGEEGCYVAFTNATCREVMNDCATFSSNPFPDNRLVALNTMSKADHSRVLRAVHGFYQAAEVGRLEARIAAVVERCTGELARDGAGDAMTWAKRIHMTSTLARLGVEWTANEPWDRVDEVIRLNDAMVALVAPLGGIGLRYDTLSAFYWLWVLLGMVQSIFPLLMMTYRFGIACTWEIIRPDTTILFPAKRPRMGLWWRPGLLPLVPRYFLALHELLMVPGAADGGAIAGIREGVARGSLRLSEALTLLVQLMVNMTSANALGSLVFRLASEKAAAEEVAADPEGLAEAFVEEVLRLDAPLQRNPRRVVADPRGRWKDTPLRQGDQVLCLLGAANMDPATFERPTEFLLRRAGGKPGALGFGSGIHYCLGSNIVKLEMKLALRCLLRDYSSVQVESHRRLVDVDVGNWGFSQLSVRLGTRDA